MFTDDILAILVAAGVGTPGTNMFESSAALIPTGAGPYLTVTETGGSGPEGTHNTVALGLPAYQRPNAQIFVRAATKIPARAMIDAAYRALVGFGMKSQSINGVWYQKIVPLQEPSDFGKDASGRICYVFNIAVTKRPNAAMSQ